MNTAITIENIKKSFIAYAPFDCSIIYFGEGFTPEQALQEFIDTEFNEYCEDKNIPVNADVVIKVGKAIYKDSPDADPEWFEDGFDFFLGEAVSTHKIKYNGKD